MPIYEYEREDGTIFEVTQSISDPVLTECPSTGQKVRKIISRSAFALKGGGWYKDGYGSSTGSAGTASKGSQESSPASGSSSTEGTKGEAKKEASSSPAKSCGSGCGCH